MGFSTPLLNKLTEGEPDFVVDVFNPANLANAPSGATHFRLDISACSE
jgi:hypothetical protein